VHPHRRGRGEEWLRALRRTTEDDAAQNIAAAVAGVRGAFVLMFTPPFGAAITVSAPFRTASAPLRGGAQTLASMPRPRRSAAARDGAPCPSNGRAV
jgi:hypothetical protein